MHIVEPPSTTAFKMESNGNTSDEEKLTSRFTNNTDLPVLQLSEPALVIPETEDDDEAIPPSPEAYGPAPKLFRCTPLAQGSTSESNPLKTFLETTENQTSGHQTPNIGFDKGPHQKRITFSQESLGIGTPVQTKQELADYLLRNLNDSDDSVSGNLKRPLNKEAKNDNSLHDTMSPKRRKEMEDSQNSVNSQTNSEPRKDVTNISHEELFHDSRVSHSGGNPVGKLSMSDVTEDGAHQNLSLSPILPSSAECNSRRFAHLVQESEPGDWNLHLTEDTEVQEPAMDLNREPEENEMQNQADLYSVHLNLSETESSQTIKPVEEEENFHKGLSVFDKCSSSGSSKSGDEEEIKKFEDQRFGSPNKSNQNQVIQNSEPLSEPRLFRPVKRKTSEDVIESEDLDSQKLDGDKTEISGNSENNFNHINEANMHQRDEDLMRLSQNLGSQNPVSNSSSSLNDSSSGESNLIVKLRTVSIITTYKEYYTRTGKFIKSKVIKTEKVQGDIHSINSSLSSHGSHFGSLNSGDLGDISSSNPSSKSLCSNEPLTAITDTTCLEIGKAVSTSSLDKSPPIQSSRSDDDLFTRPHNPLRQRYHSEEVVASNKQLFEIQRHNLEHRNPPVLTRSDEPTEVPRTECNDNACPKNNVIKINDGNAAALSENNQVDTNLDSTCTPHRGVLSARKGRGRPSKPRKSTPKTIRRSENKTVALTSSSSLASLNSPEIALPMTPVRLSESPEIPHSKILSTGLSIWAKWTDNYYYPGKVGHEEKIGRWEVIFDDGATRTTSEIDIIPKWMVTKGTSVVALCNGTLQCTGIVRQIYQTDTEDGYVIDLDNGQTQSFKTKDVILSSDQGAILTNKKPSAFIPQIAELNLDHIVEGKRRRTPTILMTQSMLECKRPKKPDPNLDTTADESSDAKTWAATKSKRESPTSRIAVNTEAAEPSSPQLAPKVSPSKSEPSLIKRMSPQKRRRYTPKSAGAAKNAMPKSQELGPIPPPGSSFFKGLFFLISCPDRCQRNNFPNDRDSGTAIICDIDREHLEQQLEGAGGTVLQTFEDTEFVPIKKVFLISNIYSRTLKYVKCLAAGIPCVNVCWVINCCEKGKMLPLRAYALPAGFSITKKAVIDWHGRNSILKGQHILLVSKENKQFQEMWRPVLLASQAEAVHSVFGKNITERSAVHMVVSDSSCPENVVRLAKDLNIPIVSTEWVIQCLINGERLKSNAHSKFHYLYKG